MVKSKYGDVIFYVIISGCFCWSVRFCIGGFIDFVGDFIEFLISKLFIFKKKFFFVLYVVLS